RCSSVRLLEITIIEPFDLLEFQKKARETCCPKKLFELWEDVCRRYDRHQIGQYDYEEMKEAIWPNLHALDLLRRTINETDPPKAQTRDKSKRKSA
ncbi:MAG: hypothetical protein KGS72_27990, partial [Cyanobacteria bacterium REEB67]|nr:hypothetical protein [Cyanobacteria bacterium REEB67]